MVVRRIPNPSIRGKNTTGKTNRKHKRSDGRVTGNEGGDKIGDKIDYFAPIRDAIMTEYYRRLCPSRAREIAEIKKIYAEIGFSNVCLWCARPLKRDGKIRTFCNGGHSSEWYNTYDWASVRNLYLFNHPTCEECGKKAEEVHHIIPFRDGGSFFQPTNLIALCRGCHIDAHLELNKKSRIAKKVRLFHYTGQQTLIGLEKVIPKDLMGTSWDGRTDISLRTIREAVK